MVNDAKGHGHMIDFYLDPRKRKMTRAIWIQKKMIFLLDHNILFSLDAPLRDIHGLKLISSLFKYLLVNYYCPSAVVHRTA